MSGSPFLAVAVGLVVAKHELELHARLVAKSGPVALLTVTAQRRYTIEQKVDVRRACPDVHRNHDRRDRRW